MEQIAGIRESLLAAVDKLAQYSSAWALLFAGLVTLVVVAVSHGARRKAMTNLPPGPRNWPIIGALLEMEPRFHKALEKLGRKYGPVVLFRMGAQTLVVVSSPEAAEELLKHKDADFSDREFGMNRSNAKYTGIDGKVLPFANYDAELRLHRKFFITENFTGAKIKSYEKLRAQELALMVEKIFDAIDGVHGSNSSKGRSPPSIDVWVAVMTMIHNVLFKLCFGKRFDSLPPTDRLREHTEIADEQMKILVTSNVVDLFPWLTWLDPQGLLKRMRKFYKRHIEWYDVILERNRQEMKLKREPGIDGIGRDPKLWKDPTQFNPDRFMAGGSSHETIKPNGSYYNLLPFGSGRRSCSGYNFAMLTVSRTVATLVHAFDWAPPTGVSPEDLSIDEMGPFILRPTQVVYLVPRPRLSCNVYKSNIT